MREIILRHWQTIAWILGATVLIPSLNRAIVESTRKIIGKDIGILDKISVSIIGGGFFSIISGIGWLLLAKYGKVSEADIIYPLLVGGVVGTVIGGIVSNEDSEDVVIIASVTAGMIASVIAGVIAGWIVGGIVGGITGVIVGAIVGWIVVWYAGDIVGGIVTVIVTVIAFLLFGIVSLISKPFSMFLRPLLILSYYRKILCTNCLHYSRPLKARYNNGERHCEYCGSNSVMDRRFLSVKEVIGLIGGGIKDFRIDHNKVYVNLWFEDEKRARSAEISSLEIRRAKNLSYGWAIEAVLNELKKDMTIKVKGIPVFIRDNLEIPSDAMKILRAEFKDVR
ncbi:MAG: hypothetical protein ACK4Z9_02645 [Thermodesulfovibrionales bacterium]